MNYYITQKPSQLGLFPKNIQLEVVPSPVCLDTLEDIQEQLKKDCGQVKIFPQQDCILLELPTMALSEMGKLQVMNFESSQRAVQNCDLISLAGRAAWSLFLGETSETIFQEWQRAKGKGNKGISWQWPGEAINSRAMSGGKTAASITRNRNSHRITSYVFSRVQLQHDGKAYVELLGWGKRHVIAKHMRDCGSYLTVNIAHLQRDRLLVSPQDFKTMFNQQMKGSI